MMTTLGEAPGGPQLIKSLIEAVKTLALLYAGTPDENAKAHLETYVDKIQPELAEAVGAGTAAKLLEGFTSAVLGTKHEIEAQGASRA
jgi:hypothetical protein